jgi:hypothetical protein
MTSGRPLNDRARSYLFYLARAMMREKAERYEINEDGCEGGVETKFTSALLGTIGGIVFWATLHTDGGSTTVRFIVRHTDLEEGDPNPFFCAWRPTNLTAAPN